MARKTIGNAITISNITSNGESQVFDMTDYESGLFQCKVTFNGSYSNESITLKLYHSVDGSDWEDTGSSLTFTNADEEVASFIFTAHNAKYKIKYTVGGGSPNYTVVIKPVLKF